MTVSYAKTWNNNKSDDDYVKLELILKQTLILHEQ